MHLVSATRTNEIFWWQKRSRSHFPARSWSHQVHWKVQHAVSSLSSFFPSLSNTLAYILLTTWHRSAYRVLSLTSIHTHALMIDSFLVSHSFFLSISLSCNMFFLSFTRSFAPSYRFVKIEGNALDRLEPQRYEITEYLLPSPIMVQTPPAAESLRSTEYDKKISTFILSF